MCAGWVEMDSWRAPKALLNCKEFWFIKLKNIWGSSSYTKYISCPHGIYILVGKVDIEQLHS